MRRSSNNLPLFSLFFSETSVNLAAEFCKNLPDAALDDFLADGGIIFNCNDSTDCLWNLCLNLDCDG